MRTRAPAIFLENGSVSAPSLSYAADPDTGFFLNAVGDLRAAVNGIDKMQLTDDGAGNGSAYIKARGIGAVGLQYGGLNQFIYYLGVLSAAVPLREADGTAAAPAYSFTNDNDTGVRLSAVGSLALTVGAQDRLVASDDGTNGSVTIGSRGSGSVALQHAGVNKWTYFAGVWSTPDPIWGSNVRYAEATAPGTPAANNVVTYAKADGKMYSKDDAGVETAMYSGAPSFPLLAPNGTFTAPSYSFTNDAGSGLWLSALGDLRIAVRGTSMVGLTNDGAGNTGTNLSAGGTGAHIFSAGGLQRLTVGPTNTTLNNGQHLAPNGTISAPSYSFTNDPDTGMWLDGVGGLRLVTGGAWKVYAGDDGTNGSVWVDARGTGSVIMRHGTVPKMFVLADRVSVVPPLALNEQAAPATPAAGELYVYAKTDGLAYAKNDAGVEMPLFNDTDDIEFMAMWGAFA